MEARGYDASSLTQSQTLLPFGCGGRYLRSHNKLMMNPQIQGIKLHATCAQEEKKAAHRRFFHRLRPPDGLHKTDTFSVHLWEPCGSTMKSASGGETRRGLKIITVSGESLPPAPPRSRHIDYRIPFPPFSLTGHVALSHSSRLLVSRGDLGSSLRAGLYAGTPRSARLLRLLR